MRKPKGSPSPRSPRKGLQELDLELSFITPVFGGGVSVDGHIKPPDPKTPIRGSAVRGQLRFWWRAMNPQGCKTVAELRKAEAEVFGSTEAASPLRIAVEQPGAGTEFPVLQGKFKAVEGCEGLAYGAFPLRNEEKGSRLPHGTLTRYSAPGKLRLSFPATVEEDLLAALYGFGQYGGLGGRTRRGFGAIRLTGCAGTIGPNGSHVPWPYLRADEADVARSSRLFDSGKDALESLLGVYKGFRQYRPRSGVDYGRSKWPEPDTIRGLTKSWSADHRVPVTHVDAFPRAHFGMPIIFSFKDDKAGDPDKTCLVPSSGARLASPLILRPFVAGKQFVAGAVRLFGTTPESAVLQDGQKKHPVRVDLSRSEADELIPLGGEPDPITAFMNRVKEI